MKKFLFLSLAIVFLVIFFYFLIDKRNIKTTCSECNVVLISLDTLSAKHLSYHGYTKATSPYLDKLAKHAFAFMNAKSTSVRPNFPTKSGQ